MIALKKAWSAVCRLWTKNRKGKSKDKTPPEVIDTTTVTTQPVPIQQIVPFDFAKFEEVLNRSNERFAGIMERAFAPLANVVSNLTTQMIEFKTEMNKIQQSLSRCAETPLAICESPHSDVEITSSIQMPEQEEEKVIVPLKRKIEDSESDTEVEHHNSEWRKFVKMQKTAEKYGLVSASKSR